MEQHSENTSVSAPVPKYTSPRPVRKPPYTLGGRDYLFALLLLAETFFIVAAGVWGGLQLGFTAAFLPLFLTFSLYLARRGAKAGAYAWACGILCVLLSAVFVCTSGVPVRFAALCAAGVLSVVWFSSLAGKPILPGELGLAERVLRQFGCAIEHLPRSVRALFVSENPQTKKRLTAMCGALCAVPVLCAVVGLLIRSDAAFEGLMHRLFADVGTLAAQLLVTLLVFPLLLSFAFSAKKDDDAPARDAAHKGTDTGFLAAFLGLLDVCYLVYLFAQLAYFFSAFSGLLPDGYSFSYADYARRGFFELCGIAAINVTILYVMLLLSRKDEGRLPVILRVLGTFTAVFTLLLICTAAAKLILYIRQYGATVSRIGAGACMLWMAFVFLALLLRFYVPRVRVLPAAALLAGVLALVLGAGNVHAFCARYNYESWQTGRLPSVDTAYLRHLGDEGIPYLVLLTQDTHADVRARACGELCLAVEERYDGETEYLPASGEDPSDEWSYLVPQSKRCTGVFSVSVPRKRAYDALDALLRDDPDFLRRNVQNRCDAWNADASLLF